MIFYFSATGNSRHIAKLIAQKTGDNLFCITECTKSGDFNFHSRKGENIGFVFPVYNFGIPITVSNFIEKMSIAPDSNYVFTVAACGGFSGGASKMLKKKLQEKGLSVNARYSVRMPDTWTPVYDLTDKEKVNKTNKKADKTAERIAEKIQIKKRGNYDYRRLPFGDYFYKDYENLRRTSSLSVDSCCIGCGLCAAKCPENAIEMQNGAPVWVKEKCAMCLGCLHRCPKFAIQRGSKTKEHGQYIHP